MSPIISRSGFSFGFGRRRGGGIILPAIGTSYEGGFFAGTISHTANGVATHALIVAPAATGATGTSYTLTTMKQWKTSNTTTAGTTSTYDGAANQAAIVTAGINDHPAAEFCENLSIGGYTDWYLPAPLELEIIYFNLKPTTDTNDTSYGANAYSVPARGSNHTSGDPAQTTVTAFQTGNSEAFPGDQLGGHISSQEKDADQYEYRNFVKFNLDFGDYDFKTTLMRVRAIRKVSL